MCPFHVCALPVVLWCMFVSEQLQIDGLRSSLHAPVLKEKKHFNHSIIGGWRLLQNLLSICWRKNCQKLLKLLNTLLVNNVAQ